MWIGRVRGAPLSQLSEWAESVGDSKGGVAALVDLPAPFKQVLAHAMNDP
jgi:hypothetical protein